MTEEESQGYINKLRAGKQHREATFAASDGSTAPGKLTMFCCGVEGCGPDFVTANRATADEWLRKNKGHAVKELPVQ